MGHHFPWIQFAIVGSALTLVWIVRRWMSRSALDNIPGPAPQSFWSGNVKQFYFRHGSEFQKHVAFNYGPVAKFYGMLCRPTLYIADPKALQTIIIKDEHIYEESKFFFVNTLLVFGPGLLSTMGEKHRKQRKLLNPAFSIKHMRAMTPIFYNVVHKVRDAISADVSDSPREVDVLTWMGRTALELIGQGGLGYSFDPLVEETEDSYGHALKSLQPNLQNLNIWRRATPYVHKLGPAWFRQLVVQCFPVKQVRVVKTIVDTMTKRSKEIFYAKRAALENGDEAVVQQVGEGKDIMSILMKANSATSEEDRLPEDEIIGQMSTLVFAATDTTSNTLARILQQLATYPDVQERLASAKVQILDLRRLGL